MTNAASGGAFSFTVEGPDQAPAIVFCNALGATRAIWRETVFAMRERYRCVTFDANGHGETAARLLPADIFSHADDLALLMDEAGIGRANIVGASIGGMTAQAFAVRYPERVDRLALVATTPQMPDPGPWTERAAKVRSEGLAEIADAAMRRWFTVPFAAANPETVEETRQAFLRTDIESYARACEAIAAMDLTEAITTITAPTLVISAAADPGTPVEMAEKLRTLIPGATLIVIPDAAHLVMVEKPAETAAWLTAFLGLSHGVEAA